MLPTQPRRPRLRRCMCKLQPRLPEWRKQRLRRPIKQIALRQACQCKYRDQRTRIAKACCIQLVSIRLDSTRCLVSSPRCPSLLRTQALMPRMPSALILSNHTALLWLLPRPRRCKLTDDLTTSTWSSPLNRLCSPWPSRWTLHSLSPRIDARTTRTSLRAHRSEGVWPKRNLLRSHSSSPWFKRNPSCSLPSNTSDSPP